MSALTQPDRSSAALPEYTLTMVEPSRDSIYSEGSSTDHGLELVDGNELNAASYVLNTSTVETPSDTSESRTDMFDTGKHGVDGGSSSSGEEGGCRTSNGYGEGTASMAETMVFRDSHYYPEVPEDVPLIPLTNGQGSSQEVESETELVGEGLGDGCKVGAEQVADGEGWLNGEHSSSSLVTQSSASGGGSSMWSEEDDMVHSERTSPQYDLLESTDEANGRGSDHPSPLLTSFRREPSPLLEQDQLDKQGHPLDTGTGCMEQSSNSVGAISASEEVAGSREETAGLADSLQPSSPCQPTPLSPDTSAPSAPTSPPPPNSSLTSPPLLWSPSSPHKPHDPYPSEGEGTSLASPPQEDTVTGEVSSSCSPVNVISADVEQIEDEVVGDEDGGRVVVGVARGEGEEMKEDGVKGEGTREGREEREEEADREEEEREEEADREEEEREEEADREEEEREEEADREEEEREEEADREEYLGEGDRQHDTICQQQGPEVVAEGGGAKETEEGVETQSKQEGGEDTEQAGDQEVASASEAPADVSAMEEVSPRHTTPAVSAPSPGGEEGQSPQLPAASSVTETEAAVGGEGREDMATTSSNSLEDELAVDLLLESNLDSSNLDTGVRVSVTPSGDLPVLQPLSPDPDLNEQYEYLRRTLSHSRRRYSTRRRRTHDGGHSPNRRGNSRYPRREGEQSRERQTVGLLRDMLHNEEAARVETHVDQHGRTYYMDHRTHTMAFEQGRGRGVDMRTRREMLDRRYRSLQRSFRGNRSSRLAGLAPIAASPSTPEDLSLSFNLEEAESLSRRDVQSQNAQPKRKSSNRWFFFGKRSSKKVYQAHGGSPQDDILPVSPSGQEFVGFPPLNQNGEVVERELEEVSGMGEGRRGRVRRSRERRSGSWEGAERRSGSHEVRERRSDQQRRARRSEEERERRSGSREERERRSGSREERERSGSREERERRSGSQEERERSGSREERERRSGSQEERERRSGSGGSEEERVRRSRSRDSDVTLTQSVMGRSEEGEGGSVEVEPFQQMSSHVGDEASSVTPGVEREELEEVEREEERGVAETEDVFAESSAVPSVGRQMSIMRASGLSQSDRNAALRARHRVRATTFSSRRPTQQRKAEDGSRIRRDTDEETNEALARTSLEASPQPEESKEMEASSEMQKEAVVSTSEGLLKSPALLFITRKDLYSFLSSAGDAGEAFFANRALMELVQRIRSNPSLFVKYQHSRQLVIALNQFADVRADLPEGWEKKLNREGKVFFIDHEYCVTTFIDPRLPLPNQSFTYTNPTPSVPFTQKMQFGGEAPIRSHHTTVFSNSSTSGPPPTSSTNPVVTVTAPQQSNQSTEMSYEMQVVSFFRSPDIVQQITQRYERGVRPQFREIIEDIRLNGTPALERIQTSGSVAAYELALVMSLFEEEISNIRTMAVAEPPPPREERNTGGPLTASTLQRKKDAFSTKLQNFKVMMSRLGFAQSSRLKFNIRRDHLLEDSYEHMMKSDVRHLQRKRLNICFKGEEGLDYGGPSREFFFLLSREIFNPYYGLFEYSANDTYTVQISPTSVFIQNNLDWFRFAGRVIGLVIVQGFLLDVFFTRTVYKALLNRPPSLKDLESLEPAFYSSLLWIRENDPEPLDLTFTVEEEAFGQLSTHELKEGGTDIPVTDENKEEYIELMLRWRLDRGITGPMELLRKGFNEVMPVSLLQMFDAQELEFLTAGTLEIDVADWRMHTEYRNGYHPTHPVILWFWQAVETFDNEQRLRLLQFVTGTSSVPFEGFKALRGSNGPKRFTIDFFSDVNSLPRTHTCFNRIDLPPYPSFEVLYHKLQIAIEEGNTFGIE